MIKSESIIPLLTVCANSENTGCARVGELSIEIINRQKAEIEELKTITGIMNTRKYYRKFVDEVFEKEMGNKRMSPDFDYIYELYFKQRAEIERLRERISYMEESIDCSRKEYNRLSQKLQQLESAEVQE